MYGPPTLLSPHRPTSLMEAGVWVLSVGLGSTWRSEMWDPGEGREGTRRKGSPHGKELEAAGWKGSWWRPWRLGRELIQPSPLHLPSEFIFYLPLPVSPRSNPQNHPADVVLIAGIYLKVLVAQCYLTLCDPMDYRPPGSSVHGLLQARIVEWAAISYSRGIFLTKGLNPGLLHCRQILYCESYQGSHGICFSLV